MGPFPPQGISTTARNLGNSTVLRARPAAYRSVTLS
jgi:hypothetical protein